MLFHTGGFRFRETFQDALLSQRSSIRYQSNREREREKGSRQSFSHETGAEIEAPRSDRVHMRGTSVRFFFLFCPPTTIYS